MTWAALALVAGACAQQQNGSPPPIDAADVRLFFPSALAVGPAGADGRQPVFVANGNFDQNFSSGSLVQLSGDAFERAAASADQRLATTAGAVPGGAGRLDNYAGRMVVSADGTRVYVTTRGSSLLNLAPVTSGVLSCPGAPRDCSATAIDLKAADLEFPYALALADVARPGEATRSPSIVVSHLAPKSIGTGAEVSDALVAVVPEPSTVPVSGPFSKVLFSVALGGFGTSSLAVDPATHEVFLGGCYERTRQDFVTTCAAAQAGLSPVRSLSLEAGSSASVQTTSLTTLLGAADIQDLALSSDGKRVYLATQGPNALVVIDRPVPGGPTRAQLRAVVPLATEPWHLAVISRTSGDLVAVTAFTSDAVLVVDPSAESVVAEVTGDLTHRLDGAFDIAADAKGERLFVTLFNACGVAAIDVPADPSQAHLAGIVGGCP